MSGKSGKSFMNDETFDVFAKIMGGMLDETNHITNGLLETYQKGLIYLTQPRGHSIMVV